MFDLRHKQKSCLDPRSKEDSGNGPQGEVMTWAQAHYTVGEGSFKQEEAVAGHEEQGKASSEFTRMSVEDLCALRAMLKTETKSWRSPYKRVGTESRNWYCEHLGVA